ncbi:MAG: TonB-dependent receptor [Myxococcales bacterium]|nr:TonB-dependent receptor [Myxococcales bacterium]
MEEAAALSEAEVIEVWAERPDKPFDRDTKLRLTGAELAARGATDLGTALALLPDVTVREGGRGGFNIDVRGARKGSVRILLDGVSVSDPYYGTFDVSTIPITDIEQIRVSTSPSSPIDGPGGPGGVVEVHTRDAIGPQLVRARLTTDSGPGASVSTSARVALGAHSALRLSMAGAAGARDFSLPMDTELGESRRSATFASRLEHRRGDRRLALDAGVDDRRYISPPSDERIGTILLIDRETTLRAQAAADDKLGALQLQARGWVDRLHRQSRFFLDPALTDQSSAEDLRALRVGGQALVTRPLGRWARWAASATVDRDSADVSYGEGRVAKGDATLTELAGDLQLERPGLLVDGAVGVAVPFGIDASPWLEGKLDVRYRPATGVELAAIAARKGRTPSLRERFDPQTGNEELSPELAHHAELRLAIEQERPVGGRRASVRLEAAPYVRRTRGTVRMDPKLGMQVNLGQLDVRGVDTSVRVALDARLEAGGGYSYIFATSDLTGDDPLDRLPRHRFDTWLRVTPPGPITALGHLRYLGRRIDQTETLGAYTTLEVSATAQLGSAYLAVVRVDDVLDVRPETRSGYHAAGRVVTVLLQGTWQ